MLEDVVIIGIVMALTELIKGKLKRVLTEATATKLLPLIVFVLAGGLNIANAALFAPEIPWTTAFRDGLVLGALAGGIYSLGKAALGRSSVGPSGCPTRGLR